MTGERLDELELDPMVLDNTALHGTAFTVSIDAAGHGVTTGISAHDRASTIAVAINPASRREDLARPGHIFPLRARPGGVLERRGQTEAAVDLARLAGLSPAGVICEIIKDDGAMARVPDLVPSRSNPAPLVSARSRIERRLPRRSSEMLKNEPSDRGLSTAHAAAMTRCSPVRPGAS